ncbi:hypothetical protein FNV43_RR16593 [Rhamnella rubrinervis]|uniref:Dirigent protein n=1 Tax=Rhamnella rubrinervis TaxID=2594499 RepID=A0A8K0GZ44_9ROSA|nr:hypothetical protein FNV43_RR15102 [Rhamnella rubrinervis]KAF3442676.1 hypothetical protein FNV43_RR16593 [Rhamnella rubrinervis]
MANSSFPNITPIFFIILSIKFFLSTHVTAQNGAFARSLSPEEFRLKSKNLTHLHFYFHDVVSGRNPTAVRVAGTNTTNNNTLTDFGAVVVMDDALTVGPESSSKLIGRAQGIYASASQTEVGFLMVPNYVFFEGIYNGSTISILGRNTILSTVREMPIVGGSGIFRFASGYAQPRTYKFDTTTLDAVVEYNVYVYH